MLVIFLIYLCLEVELWYLLSWNILLLNQASSWRQTLIMHDSFSQSTCVLRPSDESGQCRGMIWPEEQKSSLLRFSSCLGQMSERSDKTRPGSRDVSHFKHNGDIKWVKAHIYGTFLPQSPKCFGAITNLTSNVWTALTLHCICLLYINAGKIH